MTWPVPADVELVGDAVRLHTVDPDADAAELFRVLDHDAVWAHVPGRPSDPAELAEILRSRQAMPEWNVWVVRLRRPVGDVDAGAIVGMSSYLDVNPHDARLEIGSTVYAPAVWASAVNPETKLMLLGYAFDVLHAGRVQLKTDVRNHRSQQAIARLGATYEGTLRRHFRRPDGTVRDSILFSVVSEEWPEVRRRLTSRLDALDA